MALITDTSHLINTLATPEQLDVSASQLDGVPRELEDSIRFHVSRLVQAAGILLHLPQETIAQGIILLLRFWAGPEGGSMLDYDLVDIAGATLYLAAKPSAISVTPRQILTTLKYLTSLSLAHLMSASLDDKRDVQWIYLESEYEAARGRLYSIESHILHVLGFQIHVALPYTLCINYLQALGSFQTDTGQLLAKTAFAQINSALLSPQQIYLTFQPSSIATAAIYLAARAVGVKLPEVEWWEVFDVDREELGFLVVGLNSLQAFAQEELQKWAGKKFPVTVDQLRSELSPAIS